ncbi:MAG: hypothetical protein IT428_14445 [Planctomycetaceae bacterium]|nr:hypothetical protein [Planctomycetaceae bacterium]
MARPSSKWLEPLNAVAREFRLTEIESLWDEKLLTAPNIAPNREKELKSLIWKLTQVHAADPDHPAVRKVATAIDNAVSHILVQETPYTREQISPK